MPLSVFAKKRDAFDYPFRDYRLIPKRYYTNSVMVVFGNKVGTLSDANNSVIIVRDIHQANMLRGLFEMIWKESALPASAAEGRQMSAYKIMIRNSPGWRGFEDCTLGVSVTSPNWQEEHFASILDFAAANFKTIRIDVTDALYRHNFMAQGLTPREAEARANALGTSWLERHQGLIEACPVTPDVIRWGKWYEIPITPRSGQVHMRPTRARSCVTRSKATWTEFFRRQGREPTDTERNHSRDYLLEEVAVLTLQARNRPASNYTPAMNCSMFECRAPRTRSRSAAQPGTRAIRPSEPAFAERS